MTMNGWISVDDRLPNTDEYILAVIEDYGVWDEVKNDVVAVSERQSVSTYVALFVALRDTVSLRFFDGYGESGMHGTRDGTLKWTHWMPLPAPPKEVESCV